MVLILYDTDFSPPCQSVRILAKRLGLQLQLIEMDLLEKQEQKTPEFLKKNPAHTLPMLEDEGLYIWESRAILAYLVQQYAEDDQLYPKDPRKKAVVDNMLQFDLGTLYGNFAEYFKPLLKRQGINEEAKAKVIEKLEILENILKERQYLAGDHLTIADISSLCTFYIPIVLEFDLKPFPKILAWLAKVKKELPSYDEVTGKGFERYRQIVKKMIG